MEHNHHCLEGPISLPSSELWGLKILDQDGTLLGTIDSIARVVGGPVRAIVKTARRPRRFILVDISRATIRDGVVVVTSAIATPELAEDAPRSQRNINLRRAVEPRGVR